MNRYQLETQILETRAENLVQARKEMDSAQDAYMKQLRRVRWYQWIDIVLTQLGDGWDIVSDSSDPEICGRDEPLPADQYKGQVDFAHQGRPTRVWTKQQGVLYVGRPGIEQRVFAISGPRVTSIFDEVRRYITEMDVEVEPASYTKGVL
jgi:hypothetical protein